MTVVPVTVAPDKVTKLAVVPLTVVPVIVVKPAPAPVIDVKIPETPDTNPVAKI